MVIPITMERLLTLNIIERERLELHGKWEPEAILKTISAFAYDIDNWGGGYIGIGAEEKAGKLVQPAKGLDPDSKNSEKIYYIRKLASTIETPSLDEKELMSIAHNIPFHDRVNPKVEMSS